MLQQISFIIRKIEHTLVLLIDRFDSSRIVVEGLAGELWLRVGFWVRFDDLFAMHVQDFVDVDNELEDDDETLRVAIVIGVFEGQCTQEVECRKSVGRDLNWIGWIIEMIIVK